MYHTILFTLYTRSFMFPFPKKKTILGHQVSRFISAPQSDFLCTLCGMVVRDPLECKRCSRLFCTFCLICKDRCPRSENLQNCPYCKFKSLPQKPSKVLLRILNELKVYCMNKENGCEENHSLGKVTSHESVCKYRKVKCDNSHFCNKVGIAKDFIQAQFSFISMEGFVCSKRCENILKFISNTSKCKIQECLELYYTCLINQ